MDLRQLRYFIALAEELHFGRAAQKLHISQPPLSLSIRQMEEEVGGRLFDRNNRSVTLTVAGAVLYQEARKLLQQAHDVEEVTKRAVRGLAGRIRVGFVGAMLFRGLMEGVRDLQAARPDIEISLHEMNTGEQILAIEREQIDVGFIHSGHLGPEIASCHMLNEPFVCCLPTSHPYASKGEISLMDLRDENFILFPRALSSHYYDRIVAMCITAGFSPHIRHEVRHWLTVVRMVEEGMGVALVPSAMRGSTFQQVKFLQLSDTEILSETLCIWHRRHASPVIENLIASVRRSMCSTAASR